MNYGYFDEANREYVITRPDTPAPWANYLGSPEYGALISNNAGGYSFVRSGANGRLLRYQFDGQDKPGRYIYIRDNADGDFWSASWQPVGKPLDAYRCECRHGLGYTVMTAEYGGIFSKTAYYVPAGKEYEVWYLTIRNDSDRTRELTVTGYAEFTNNSNYEQDGVNLQYSRFVTQTKFRGNRILHQVHGNLEDVADKGPVDSNGYEERFFGLAGSPVSSYCGDRDVFLGSWHGYGDPEGVAKGDLGNRLNYNEYGCGALSTVVALEPGACRKMAFLLGGKPDAEAEAILREYECGFEELRAADGAAGSGRLEAAADGSAGSGQPGGAADGAGGFPESCCDRELDELKELWDERLSALRVKTPSPEFDAMVNTWNAYNCFMTFIWSRAASFVYCGLRNGYGYRDTVQDIQGVIHLAPEMAADKIRFMLTAQVDNGAGLPLVKFTHNPGHEDTPDDASYVKETGHPAYRADDALWLFPTVYKYVAETGNTAFLDEVLPFANKDEGTVYEHLKRAVRFSMEHLGPHGLPAGLYADWNDCLRLGANGESSFVAFQFYYAMKILRIFALEKGEAEDAAFLSDEIEKFGKLASDLLWDEDRFVRGFTEAGEVIGRRDAAEASMWLNPQSWAVISGLADAGRQGRQKMVLRRQGTDLRHLPPETGDTDPSPVFSPSRAETAMQKVYELLNTEYGAILMDPPFRREAFDGALAVIYNQGVKENAGIFSQSQGWLVLAEALLGHGDRAFQYWLENAPSAQNDRAEIRRLEPYCYGQFTEGKASPHFGRSHVHWLTGTASTMMVGVVEGILGLRPDLKGLRIAPSIPSTWNFVEMDKSFRGCRLHIRIENPDHRESGCRSLILNGRELEENYIPAEALQKENEVVVKM